MIHHEFTEWKEHTKDKNTETTTGKAAHTTV